MKIKKKIKKPGLDFNKLWGTTLLRQGKKTYKNMMHHLLGTKFLSGQSGGCEASLLRWFSLHPAAGKFACFFFGKVIFALLQIRNLCIVACFIKKKNIFPNFCFIIFFLWLFPGTHERLLCLITLGLRTSRLLKL
ncbi:MAG: hypothetical protein O7D30_13010 [Rickettsia endosymbiont of Ixodes persulcatus]|nr:hypothetical protein [Rickettsia endosymbiont of Ixodes persulcatus]